MSSRAHPGILWLAPLVVIPQPILPSASITIIPAEDMHDVIILPEAHELHEGQVTHGLLVSQFSVSMFALPDAQLLMHYLQIHSSPDMEIPILILKVSQCSDAYMRVIEMAELYLN